MGVSKSPPAQAHSKRGWENRAARGQESHKASKPQKNIPLQKSCRNNRRQVYQRNRVCCFEPQLFAVTWPCSRFSLLWHCPPSSSVLPRALGELPFQPVRCFWDTLTSHGGVPGFFNRHSWISPTRNATSHPVSMCRVSFGSYCLKMPEWVWQTSNFNFFFL